MTATTWNGHARPRRKPAGTGFSFGDLLEARLAARDAARDAETPDVTADRVRAADERARDARSGRAVAVAEARRLRLELLAAEVERAARRDPARFALSLAAWARASNVPAVMLDDLIATVWAATDDEGGGDAVG